MSAAVRWASAKVVSIGLVPEAVGNALLSGHEGIGSVQAQPAVQLGAEFRIAAALRDEEHADGTD